MKISMMSCTMARPSEFFGLKAMFELTAELKLGGVDMVTLYDRSAAELKKMADDYGVPVVCHTFFAKLDSIVPELFEQSVDLTKRGIEAAVILGAPIVLIATPNFSGLNRDDDRNRWIKGLNAVMAFAKQAGVTLTVENFPGENSPFVTANDFLTAAAKVEDLKLTFDNGNAASGEEPSLSFTRCKDYVVHAHFKDWDVSDVPTEGYRRMLDGKYYRPALIGEGDVDHLSCIKAMKTAGYDGCINIEYEGNKYRPDEAVRRAVDYLRGLDAEL